MKLPISLRIPHLLLCGLAFSLATLGFGQNRSSRENPASRDATNRSAAIDPEYRLRNDDTVAVHVIGQTEFSTEQRIDNSGTIRMWQLEQVSLAGKTVHEAEMYLQNLLIEKKLLKKPHVQISVRDYKPREIYLDGFINHPGIFVLPGDEPSIELKKLILARGGLQPKAAGSRAEVKRAGRADSEKVDIERMLKGKGPDSFLIYPGDTIYVPPKWF